MSPPWLVAEEDMANWCIDTTIQSTERPARARASVFSSQASCAPWL